MSDDKYKKKISTREIFVKGSIIALIITIPSLVAFLVGWQILNDLIMSAVIGTIVHFCALVCVLKFSKKIFVKKT